MNKAILFTIFLIGIIIIFQPNTNANIENDMDSMPNLIFLDLSNTTRIQNTQIEYDGNNTIISGNSYTYKCFDHDINTYRRNIDFRIYFLKPVEIKKNKVLYVRRIFPQILS